MKIRLKNALVLPRAGGEIFRGEVQIEDGKIVYAGKQNDRMFFPADREKDCGGNLLIPGFCNAHAHSAMTLFRGVADDLPFHAAFAKCEHAAV